MIFCEHWYYSQASYKGDHELLGYQPFEEGEGRDVNNGNSGACCTTDQIKHKFQIVLNSNERRKA